MAGCCNMWSSRMINDCILTQDIRDKRFSHLTLIVYVNWSFSRKYAWKKNIFLRFRSQWPWPSTFRPQIFSLALNKNNCVPPLMAINLRYVTKLERIHPWRLKSQVTQPNETLVPVSSNHHRLCVISWKSNKKSTLRFLIREKCSTRVPVYLVAVVNVSEIIASSVRRCSQPSAAIHYKPEYVCGSGDQPTAGAESARQRCHK